MMNTTANTAHSQVARHNIYVSIAAKLTAASEKMNIEAAEAAALLTSGASQELTPKQAKRLASLYNAMHRRIDKLAVSIEL